jgi:hypothetical protein
MALRKWASRLGADTDDPACALHDHAPKTRRLQDYRVVVFEKIFGPMNPAERRMFVGVGLPSLCLFVVGGGIAAIGDATARPALMAVGFPIAVVGFIIWGVVVHRLVFNPSPALKVWQKDGVEGPAANKFNTAVCSVLAFFGLGMLIRDPSPFAVVFAAGSIGLLALFVRRGWPDAKGKDG